MLKIAIFVYLRTMIVDHGTGEGTPITST